jgi:hypothetical protein
MYVINFDDGQTIIRKDQDLSQNDLGANAISATPIKEVKIKDIWEKGQQLRCELMPNTSVQPPAQKV